MELKIKKFKDLLYPNVLMMVGRNAEMLASAVFAPK